MRKGFIASALVILLVSAFWISIPTGCANIIPPSGGPRDTIPPVFISAVPKDSTVNFKGDRIVLNFNEDIDDPRNASEIIYTPSMDIPPTITSKGKALTVKFNDTTLQPNTTYVINFGNQIVDLTESNPVKNFVYTFSTGPFLDSLEISGRVIMAETGAVDSNFYVALYKDLADTVIRTKRPQYLVRLDRNGNFKFHNLPKDTFAIYAFGNGQRNYQPRSAFAFADTPVVAGETDSLILYAFQQETAATNQPSSLGAPTAKIPANDRRLRVTPSATAQQELTTDFTLSFPIPLGSFDSTKMHLATDSVFNPANFTASLDTSKKAVHVKTEWKEGTPYHLILEKEFATDTAGRQLLKTDTLSFVTKKKTDYGSLVLRIKNIASFKNPVLQFVQNNQVVLSVPIKSGTYSQSLFTPGEYTLRIFEDENGNGKWDTGKFFKEKRQPEKVRTVAQTINVKANWDNEVERVL